MTDQTDDFKKEQAIKAMCVTLAKTLNEVGGAFHPKHEWQIMGTGNELRLVAKDGSYREGALDRATANRIKKALEECGIGKDPQRPYQGIIQSGATTNSSETDIPRISVYSETDTKQITQIIRSSYGQGLQAAFGKTSSPKKAPKPNIVKAIKERLKRR